MQIQNSEKINLRPGIFYSAIAIESVQKVQDMCSICKRRAQMQHQPVFVVSFTSSDISIFCGFITEKHLQSSKININLLFEKPKCLSRNSCRKLKGRLTVICQKYLLRIVMSSKKRAAF